MKLTDLIRSIACGLLLLSGSCSKPQALPVSGPPTEKKVAEKTTPTTEAECREFAEALEKAARNSDRAKLDSMLDLNEMAIRALASLPISEGEREGILGWLRSVSSNGAPLTRSILSGMDAGGSYKLLHVRMVDGRPRATFRLYRSDEGTNYHEIITAKRPDGRIVVDELYLFLSGEPMTSTMRRVVLPSVAEVNRKAIEQLKGDDGLYVSQLRTITAFSSAISAGKRQDARDLYDALPTKVREMKPIALLRVKMNAGGANEKDYRAAIADLQRLFPGDPLVDYLAIDYYVLGKQYDQANDCIDRVDRAIGGDPAMRSMKGNVYMAAGKYREANEVFEKTIREDPQYRDAYWGRITVALKEKKFAEVLSWLKTLVEQTSESVSDLSRINGFGEFVTSQEHKSWIDWYATRKKLTP